MPTVIKFEATKTYATKENAIKAVEQKYAKVDQLRYFIMPTPEGRFYPIFVGTQAIDLGVHFHFHVVA